MNHPIVLAISGASGAVYSARLLQCLLASGKQVHLTISPAGQEVIYQELGVRVDLRNFDPMPLLGERFPAMSSLRFTPVRRIVDGNPTSPTTCLSKQLSYHHFQDMTSSIASGSFVTAGMVICPCSGSTLGAIVHASGSNLIHRAAEVHLKERRKLVVVPRETPLSVFQLENMHRAAQAGVVVLPAAPGWYHGVEELSDLVEFVVARILDQLGVDNQLIRRWNGSDQVGSPNKRAAGESRSEQIEMTGASAE